MALTFSTTAQQAQQNGVKCLVYGRAGVGKTVLAATAPTPIIFSAEAGLLSLRHTEIPVAVIKNIDDLQEAFKWATESHEAKGFETICLDSISEIAEVVLANAKATAKDPRQAYGELADRMQHTIRSFRDIQGKNVYMTAKMVMNKDDNTGIQSYGPSMPGRTLTQGISYFFDEVFNINVNKDQEGNEFRYLRTRPDFQYEAKDRSGALVEFEPADLTAIFNKIKLGN